MPQTVLHPKLAPLSYLHVLKLPFVAPEGLVESFFDNPTSIGFLSDGGDLGRWSWLSCQADWADVFEFTDTRDPEAILDSGLKVTQFKTLGTEGDVTDLPPFTGGLVGMASFELGMRLEKLKARPFRILLRVPAILALDHRLRRVLAIGRGRDPLEAFNRAQGVQKKMQVAVSKRIYKPKTPLMSAPLCSETPDEVHEDKITTLVQQIHAGDLFQANLARGWQGRLSPGVSPGQVMNALYRKGPSPFGGFFRLNHRAILSNSPERFIRLKANGQLETRPIKGTRPRGKTPKADLALSTALLNSAKDLSENLMIVDLMRHDLSKVSEVGSVKVTALQALETYPNVHHLVSTITSTLKAALSAGDVLIQSFPPGSISGAPKVQALKVIQELEAPRGPYCGSMFYIDVSGTMDSNVLIRTIVCECDEASLWHVRVCSGGGIIAESQPIDERLECETKLSLIRSVLES
jgi:para-aminobenzoate synthetase component I